MSPDPTFESQRPRLFGLAYRLLGSRSDAEDVLQDAWLRWQSSDRAAIRDPEAWLVTTTTRLGLDRLRAARSARVHYTGPWLPEPLEIAEDTDPAERHARAEQVSVAFLALLERLGPEERAAFLLKEAFDYDYAQIGQLLGHAEANCRQLVHRARERLKAGRPRFAVTPQRHRQLLERFMHASQQGDRGAIVALLDANARMFSDGGGKVTATLRPLLGAERIAMLYWAVARRGLGLQARIGTVNGEPAILRFIGARLHSAVLVVIDGERIVEVLTLMNPDKLPPLAGAGAAASA
ncbi:RNA polymerase sigma-70 factor (ECF subfamily) [Xanthomonas sp. JAI131]|uniref:RNA polymerase sigma-70 factor n=1 Tax=Xanthomonas sp. JAI131 TaxID=2723067 RepID=UPI0015CBE28C|nr:RNA polymerase sigma-70 factor [Xanthomonas sp. JAI131]NYF19728.1 RNA polymerase sigma-70 factor (ECF subfamily) [Xanthomonas sp. JAI131]